MFALLHSLARKAVRVYCLLFRTSIFLSRFDHRLQAEQKRSAESLKLEHRTRNQNLTGKTRCGQVCASPFGRSGCRRRRCQFGHPSGWLVARLHIDRNIVWSALSCEEEGANAFSSSSSDQLVEMRTRRSTWSQSIYRMGCSGISSICNSTFLHNAYSLPVSTPTMLRMSHSQQPLQSLRCLAGSLANPYIPCPSACLFPLMTRRSC